MMITLLSLSLPSLSGCMSSPVRSDTDYLKNILALTEPTPGPGKKIEELETQGDEETFIVEADAGLKKANADKLRIRALVTGGKPKKWWKKILER